MYPPELQLNIADASDTEAPFLDLHLFNSNGVFSSKINDKSDDSSLILKMLPIWMVTFSFIPLMLL